MKRCHPIADERDRARILTDPFFSDYLENVKQEGERYLAVPAGHLSFSLFRLFYSTGDRLQYESIYFDRRGRLACFGLLCWLYDDEKYVHALEDIIWLILDEYTWALPAHLGESGLSSLENNAYTIDLFSAETASALSEIISLVSEKLHPITLIRARHEIRKRVVDRFLEGSFSWQHAKNNWSAVCAGAVGLAAMYETESDEQRDLIINKLQAVMEVYLSSFPEDGTSVEGLAYWYYGFMFFVAYADMLKKASDGQTDWFCDKRVHSISLFQQKAYFDRNHTVSFSDTCCEGFTRWLGLTSYLKRIYDDMEFPPLEGLGSFNSDHCFRWVTILRDLVWADTCITGASVSPRSWILKDAQWLICNATDVGFAAKGGNNGESHNHNDLGSFQFLKNEEELLIDFGAGVYSRQYFGPERYHNLACSSLGHCVPIIEGMSQIDGAEHAAKDVRFGEWFLDMELSEAYNDPELISFRRRFSFDEQNHTLCLFDSFKFRKPCKKLTERFVTYGNTSVSDRIVHIKGNKSYCDIEFDADKLSPVFSDFILQNHSGKDIQVNVCDFEARTECTEYLFTFIIK